MYEEDHYEDSFIQEGLQIDLSSNRKEDLSGKKKDENSPPELSKSKQNLMQRFDGESKSKSKQRYEEE